MFYLMGLCNMIQYLLHWMFKVREKLITKELVMEKSEKARKMREMKKYGKKVGIYFLLMFESKMLACFFLNVVGNEKKLY